MRQGHSPRFVVNNLRHNSSLSQLIGQKNLRQTGFSGLAGWRLFNVCDAFVAFSLVGAPFQTAGGLLFLHRF